MFRKLMATAPTWYPLPVRLALGIIFIGHGAQKVFGWWGGSGWSAFIQNPAPWGLQPSKVWMGAAALSELIGGAMVLVGFLTRLGAFSLAVVMAVAMIGVHWGAFFLPSKGIEYTVALLGMSLALLISGAGQASIDMKLSKGRK